MSLICYDEQLIDNNTYNKDGIGRRKMNLEWILWKWQEWFYEILCKFNILCNRQLFHSFAVHTYYHKSYFIKYNIYPTENQTKIVMTIKFKINISLMKDEVIQKFNQALIVRIIRNMEAFLLHDNLGYLKELSDDHGIQPIFTYS